MNPSIFAYSALLLAPLASCTSPASEEGNKELPEKPNIIFIITDDMTPDMFNFLPEGEGQNLTPALDQLAEEGTVMRNQYVVSPVSTPSRFNCLTGLFASRAQNKTFLRNTKQAGGQTVVRWNSHITPKTPTFPEMLQENGYTTGAVGKNHVIQVPDFYKAPWDADPTDPEIKSKLQANAKKIRKAYQKSGFDFAERIYYNNPDGNGAKELAVHNMDWITEGGLQFIE